jgi:hypothetical protein
MSWSRGKDSAFALHTVRTAGQVPITALLSTVHTASDRVASHGVRRVLLQAQAAALGLPLHVVELPTPCPNDVYEQAMGEVMMAAGHAGAEQLVFGDLFLADVRAYREQALHGTGITPVFPLWHRPTAALAADMLACGLRAVITCVDPAQARRSSPDGGMTRNCCGSYRPGWTRVVSAVSSTPSSWTVPGSPPVWTSSSASGTGSCSPTFSRPERRPGSASGGDQIRVARSGRAATTSGWMIAARASTPSSRRGPGRTNAASASTAHTGTPAGR